MFILTGVCVLSLVMRCMNVVQCAIALLMGVLLKKTRIYPRNCFACEKRMRLIEETTTLVCDDCSISEDGTVKGRFHYPLPALTWDDMIVETVDHSLLYCPSPDVGYDNEFVPLVESPLLTGAHEETGT